ncbi:MAG: FAD-dependent oxidoreductase [Coriobacteriales bacterium]|nr:FAD-dependent oxidoreductase [Coriobacteriales bacterium]
MGTSFAFADAPQASEETTADLIVVGAGSAGLTAAAKAAQDGAKVIVLEAAPVSGGTTKICGAHWKFMNEDFMSKLPERTEDSDKTISAVLDWNPDDFGAYAEACKTCKADVEAYLASDNTLEFDSIEYWLCLHFLGTKGVDLDGVEAVADYDVVAPSYYNSGEIAEWIQSSGLKLSDPQPNNRGAGGPLSIEPEGQGFGLIQALEGMALDAGAQIIFDTKAVKLVTDESGKVCGVVAEGPQGSVTYAANKLVLLATGGYCSNGEMVAKQNYFTGIDDTAPSCEPATCDGTGIMMAQELGAATANMSFVQFFGFPEAQMGSIETLFPKMGVCKFICNLDGVRFTNDQRSFFGGGDLEGVRAICEQPRGRYFFVGDAAAQEARGDNYADDVKVGLIVEGETPVALAEAAGINAANFEATVEAWNGYVDAGEDPDFGRNMERAAKVETAPFVVMPMAAYAQNTMGGLVINPQGQVVTEAGTAIEGLYAAGEVTGNLDGACRRHGDNFAQILYYGWLAGKTVAKA